MGCAGSCEPDVPLFAAEERRDVRELLRVVWTGRGDRTLQCVALQRAHARRPGLLVLLAAVVARLIEAGLVLVRGLFGAVDRACKLATFEATLPHLRALESAVEASEAGRHVRDVGAFVLD